MKAHIEKTKSYLGELAALQAKSERAERKILESAEARLAVVQGQIERAQVGIEAVSDEAQDRYVELVSERGKLHMVIAKARKNLSE